MSTYPRPRGADWIACLFASTLLGVVFLGVGGRIGMRVIALTMGQSPGLTVGGSLTVVFLGAAAGTAIGAIFLLSRTLFPRHRIARGALFWLVVGAFVVRGLNPLTTVTAVVFMPLFLIHGGLLFGYWCRVRMRKTRLAMGPLDEELNLTGALRRSSLAILASHIMLYPPAG